MTINNINLIKPLLIWEDPNDFYFVQILKRKKENPDIKSNNSTISTYYINSIESLVHYFPEMILLAKFHNARVYINLNRRNYEQLGFQMLKKLSDCLINKAYKDIRNAYNSICGSFHVEKSKKWVIDIDYENYSTQQIQLIKNIIYELEGTVYEVIPTINGTHYITNPINTQKFSEKCIENKLLNIPDIQKNNPTLLYYSNENIN